jgi:hypothetical protein
MEPRLKTSLVVQAALKVSIQNAIPMVVTRRGDGDAGSILIKINRLELGCVVLAQTRTPTGELAWLKATGDQLVEEQTAEAYIARQIKRDPDLWVVEIEDRAGRAIFDGRIL